MIRKRRGNVVFSFIGILFFFFNISIWYLQKKGDIVWSAGFTIGIAAISIILGVFAGTQIARLLEKEIRIPWKEREDKKAEKAEKTEKAGLSWLLIFICWLPGFLAYYPAICAYDNPAQIEQCASGIYIDHHPYMHTLLLNFFWRMGRDVLGDANLGYAALALVQMLLLSGVFALGIHMLKRRGCRKWILRVLLALACLYPFHMFMSISITKDTLFAVFLLLLTLLLLYSLTGKEEGGFCGGRELLMGLSVMPVVWLRNNARYAILFALFILLLLIIWDKARRRSYFRVGLTLCAGLFLGMGIMWAGGKAVDVTQGDKREMLSVPMQQLARVLYYEEEEMEQADVDFLGGIILNRAWEKYDPIISDPVKRHIYTGGILNELERFANLYGKLLFKYPSHYINAVLLLDGGYLYVFDESAAMVNLSETESGLGYVQTRWVDSVMKEHGVVKQSLLPGLRRVLETWASENQFLDWPIVKYFLLPGPYLWIYLIMAGVIWYRRKYQFLLPLSLSGGYLLTLLLGPAVQLRYIYPVMICVPFLLAFFAMEKKGKFACNERLC